MKKLLLIAVAILTISSLTACNASIKVGNEEILKYDSNSEDKGKGIKLDDISSKDDDNSLDEEGEWFPDEDTTEDVTEDVTEDASVSCYVEPGTEFELDSDTLSASWGEYIDIAGVTFEPVTWSL